MVMSEPRAEPQIETAERHEPARACYVYGLVPADACLPEGLTGIGRGEVSLVRHRDLAGVVSEIASDAVLGTGEDLRAHDRVVASLAAQHAVLPMRFGAVVTTADAVVTEMLRPYHDWFTAVMADLTGRMEFTVTGTYVQDTVLREVLLEQPEAMRLRKTLDELPEDAGYSERVQLGELIVQALEAKRAVDTEALLHTLAPYAVAVATRESVDEEIAADVAFLIADEDRARFDQAVDELGRRWAGRIRLCQIGPLAPYHFVPESLEGG
jgi:hypothetical protein